MFCFCERIISSYLNDLYKRTEIGWGGRERSDRVSGNTENIGHSEGEREKKKNVPNSSTSSRYTDFLIAADRRSDLF